MKLSVMVCLENGDIIESDWDECPVEDYEQAMGILKQFKNLEHFCVVKNGNSIYINPDKIMWFEPRISE